MSIAEFYAARVNEFRDRLNDFVGNAVFLASRDNAEGREEILSRFDSRVDRFVEIVFIDAKNTPA